MLGVCEAAELKTVNSRESLPTNFDHKSIQFLQIISKTVNKASRWPNLDEDNLACACLNFCFEGMVERVTKQTCLTNNLITMKFGLNEMRISRKSVIKREGGGKF